MKNDRDFNFKTEGLKIKSIGILLSLFALYVAFVVYKSNTKGIYQYIWLLPIVFAIINFIFIDIYKRVTIVSCIVIGMEFIRYVLTPVILMIDDYPIGLYTYIYDKNNMITSTFIMVYEILIIYYCLYYCRKFSDIVKTDDELIESIVCTKNFSSLRISSYCILIFTLIIYMIFPSLKNIYSFLLSGNLDSLTDSTSIAIMTLPSGIGWLGSVLGDISRYILLGYILFYFFKKDCYLQRTKNVIIPVILIIMNMMFVSSSMIISLLSSIVLLLQIYILFPRFRKFFILVGVLFGIVVIFVVIMSYLQNALTYHSLSQMIQDYTNGFYNIYQAQCAYKSYHLDLLNKYIMLFLGDGIANISPINILFNTLNSSDIFNYYLYGMKFNGGAVLPYVSHWTYYFTAFVGPLFSALPIIYAKKMEYRWRNGEGNLLISGMLALIFALTPFMYNIPTLIHIITMTILPLWVASKCNAIFILKK